MRLTACFAKDVRSASQAWSYNHKEEGAEMTNLDDELQRAKYAEYQAKIHREDALKNSKAAYAAYLDADNIYTQLMVDNLKLIKRIAAQKKEGTNP